MMIRQEYFPIITGFLAAVCCLNLYLGWKKGFLFRLVDLAGIIVSLFIAWPAAKMLSGVVFLAQFLDIPSAYQTVVNQALWFVLVFVILKILLSGVYAAAGLVKKIGIINLADHVAGLALSAVTLYACLCVLCLFLQLPVIENGAAYVDASPLRYVSASMPVVFDMISKGEFDLDAIRSLILQGA